MVREEPCARGKDIIIDSRYLNGYNPVRGGLATRAVRSCKGYQSHRAVQAEPSGCDPFTTDTVPNVDNPMYVKCKDS